MPIRSATSRARRRLSALALAAALLLAPAGPAPATEEIALSLDQARGLAVHAIRNGNPGLAVQLARGLLAADPDDPLAHYVIAAAHARADRPGPGRKSAARAYRGAQSDAERFLAAQMAARMAYAEDRLSLAQLWLRRAAIHAPDAGAEEVVARDYTVLRRLNPWSFRIQADLRPSSNVNKGADTALQIIDGVPVTGVLSGAARALPGLIGALDLSAGYRFRRSAQSASSVAGRLYIQRVALSSAAQAQAPRARNSDFASTFAELSLRHGFLVGPEGAGGSASVDLTAGEAWYGGRRSFSFARLTGERRWQLAGGGALDLHALYEDRFRALVAVNDAQVLGLGARWRQPLANGDRLSLSLALRESRAAHPNGSYWSASMRAAYDLGRPVGPMHLRAGLVLGYSDYPVFRSAGFLTVPGGRQDKSVYGDLSMIFHDFDYAGFAPTLRLRAGRKFSNDSRYSMRELSLSLGFESEF